MTEAMASLLEFSLSLSVCRCSQTAGRNSCSIVSGDVSNCSYRLTVHPLSRVRVSVWPSNFLYAEKHSKRRGNRAASASVYFNGQRPAIVTSGAGHHGWLAQTHRIAILINFASFYHSRHTGTASERRAVIFHMLKLLTVSRRIEPFASR